MATIHHLKQPDSSSRNARAPIPSTGAEIIFFPGVRYERWTDSAANSKVEKQKRKRRTRVKRDKIAIRV